MTPRNQVGCGAIVLWLLWVVGITYGVTKGILFYLGIEVSGSALFPFVTLILVPALLTLGVYRGLKRLKRFLTGE